MMLQKDVKKRITFQDVLRHPWMRRYAAGTPRPTPLSHGPHGVSASSDCLSLRLESEHHHRSRRPPCESQAGWASPERTATSSGIDESPTGSSGGAAANPGRRCSVDFNDFSTTSIDSTGGGGGLYGPEAPRRGTVNLNRAVESVASARIFFAPENLGLRLALHGFLDIFKSQVRAR